MFAASPLGASWNGPIESYRLKRVDSLPEAIVRYAESTPFVDSALRRGDRGQRPRGGAGRRRRA